MSKRRGDTCHPCPEHLDEVYPEFTEGLRFTRYRLVEGSPSTSFRINLTKGDEPDDKKPSNRGAVFGPQMTQRVILEGLIAGKFYLLILFFGNPGKNFSAFIG
jgi:hypothetical protein